MRREQIKITWKRVGNDPKSKLYFGMKRAEHFLKIIGPEPWTAFNENPDARACCSGYECGCGGQTVREHWEAGRKDLPPVEWIKIAKRTVTYGEWEAVSAETVTPEVEAQAYIVAHPEQYPGLNEGAN